MYWQNNLLYKTDFVVFYATEVTNSTLQIIRKYALVIHMSPVHWCKNAQDLDHDCVYAICYNCKLAYDARNDVGKGKNKRSRKCAKRTLTAMYDNAMHYDSESDDDKCNHHMDWLQQTCDTLYFTTMYIGSINEQGIAFPTKCSVCHLTFSSEKSNLKKHWECV